MKQTLCCLLASVLLLSCCGCNQTEQADSVMETYVAQTAAVIVPLAATTSIATEITPITDLTTVPPNVQSWVNVVSNLDGIHLKATDQCYYVFCKTSGDGTYQVKEAANTTDITIKDTTKSGLKNSYVMLSISKRKTVNIAYQGSTAQIDPKKEYALNTIYTDIHETNLLASSKLLDRVKENEEIGVMDYLLQGRIDVVDANGYDHQGMVYLCSGSDSYTKAFHAYVENLTSLGNTGEVIGYRNVTRSNLSKTYSQVDIDFLVVQRLTLIGSDGTEYEAFLVALDGSEAFLTKQNEWHNQFKDAY